MINKNGLTNFDWIAVNDMTAEDRQVLMADMSIPQMMLDSAQDKYELAHFQLDPVTDYRLMIFNVLVMVENQLKSRPITMIFQTDSRQFLTITDQDTVAFQAIFRASLLAETTPMGVVVSVENALADDAYHQILKINQTLEDLQTLITKRAQSSKIIAILNDLKANVVHISLAIHNNDNLITAYQDLHKTELSTKEQQSLRGLTITLRQLVAMITTTEQLTTVVSETLDSSVNSRLNWIMQLLTVFSVVLTVPTIISGFWGENVRLPCMNSPYGWQLTLLVMAVFMLILVVVLAKLKLFRH